jgi:hypothetical protein
MFFLLFSAFAIARYKMAFFLKEFNISQFNKNCLGNTFANLIYNFSFKRKSNGWVSVLSLSLNCNIVKTYCIGLKGETTKGESMLAAQTE